MLQNTNYVDIYQVINLEINLVNFNNITYINTGDSGVFLIYIEQVLSTSMNITSYIQNVVFDQIKTNTVAFGGFAE